MIYKSIPFYSYETNSWSYKDFTKDEWKEMLLLQNKLPSQYELKNTKDWITARTHYTKHDTYTNLEENSEDWKEFWKFEKEKIGKGAFFGEVYVPGTYYFYLNYCPIYDKVKGNFAFVEVWDSDFHFFLYVERCIFFKKDAIVIKVRQKGYSYKWMSIIMRSLWFVAKSTNKVISYDETYVEADWIYASDYRNHLNQHTPWYRNFDPDEKNNWQQRVEIQEGVVNKKKKYKGLHSRMTGATFSKNVAKSVGGSASIIFVEEPGIAPNLKKVKSYTDANLRMGGVKTGLFAMSGSVGELKDCVDFQEYCTNPSIHGFLGVEDVFSGKQNDIAFFVPVYWNYITEFDGEIIKCYDEDGNSDIELAKHWIEKEDAIRRLGDSESYRIWLSQNPKTIDDAFSSREENIFPVFHIKEYQLRLQNTYKPTTIRINNPRNNLKEINYEFIPDSSVKTLKVDPKVNNCGCVEMLEPPIPDAPFGLYYAGVDPIRPTNTSTSKSLQSVVIMKAFHEKDGKLIGDYPVAWYTGRCNAWEDSYQITRDLILMYNARTAVESNISGFIDWMINQSLGAYLMRRKEIHLINEWFPTSTTRDEIGVRMVAEFKKKSLDFAVQYVDEIISTSREEKDGVVSHKPIYGIERIKDVMLIEEMLQFNPNLNTDRLVAFMLALVAARSNTSRHFIIKEDSIREVKESKIYLTSNLVMSNKSSNLRGLPSSLKNSLRRKI